MSKIFFIACMACCVVINAYAEKVILKSGKTLEGAIVEKTDTYIKMTSGDLSVPLTYYMDDIKSIDGRTPTVVVSPDTTVAVKDTLLPFQLGICKVGDNEINFEFPGGGSSLYAFDMKEWNGKGADSETKLVISLYDKDKKLIEKSKSVCAAGNMKSFGSLSFDTDKKTVGSVAYFSAGVEACVEKGENALDAAAPQVLFAQKVVEAIKKSKEDFTALYSSKPSEKMAAMEQFMYQSLKGMLSSGGKLGEVIPIEGKKAEQYKGLCDKPYTMEISQKTKDGATTSLSFPIGEVKGEWKVLNVDEK